MREWKVNYKTACGLFFWVNYLHSLNISLWFKGSYFLSALTFYLMPSTVPYSYFPVGTEAAVVVRSGFIGFAVTIHQGTRGWLFSAAPISHTLGVSKRLFFFPPCDHIRIRFPSNQLSNLNRPWGIWFQTRASLSLTNPRYWCQWFSNIGLLLLMMFASAFPSYYFRIVRFLSRYNSPQCDVVCVPVINYPGRMAV